MGARKICQQFTASLLSLLLAACCATRYVETGPSGPKNLSQYVLILQQGPDGQVSHSWTPVSDFDLSQYPYHAGNTLIQGRVTHVAFNRDCEAERDECEAMCLKSLRGRNWTHASGGSKDAICRDRCRPAYLDCSRLKELSEAKAIKFQAVDRAIDWLKRNQQELVVGTIVVIAGVAFVVAVAGSGGGALVLAPAILLVSIDGIAEPHIATVQP